MTEPIVYSLAQAARVLGVHYETVARWVRTGKIHGVKLSRRKVVILKEQLDAFVTGNTSLDRQETLPQIGSPQRWRMLAGTLTPEEAAALRASAQDFESVQEGS